VSAPTKEYPQFEAALSLLPVLPPEEVADLLDIRLGLLQKTIDGFAEHDRVCREIHLPRLFSLETEYYKAITLAEYEFTKGLLADILRDSGGLRSGWTKMREEVLSKKKLAPVTPKDSPATPNKRKGRT
jgi:hypothetical protein